VKSPPETPGQGPNALRYAGLGIQLAVTVAFLAWVGSWLDRRLGTHGVVTILLVLIGFAGTIVSLLRELRGGDGK
jgi:hypothetical protein